MSRYKRSKYKDQGKKDGGMKSDSYANAMRAILDIG
jgi:hypothetical protein